MQLNPEMKRTLKKGQHFQPQLTFNFQNKRSDPDLLNPAAACFTETSAYRSEESGIPYRLTGILHLADCLQLTRVQ